MSEQRKRKCPSGGTYYPDAQKRRRERLIAEGKCVVCGREPAADGRRTCTKCGETSKLATKKYHGKLSSMGLCVRGCGEKVAGGRSVCGACLEKVIASQQEHRRSRAAGGLCVQCGKRPPIDRRVKCGECLEKLRASGKKKYAESREYRERSNASSRELYRKRRRAGACSWCKAPSELSRCEACLAKGREIGKRIRQARKEAGICARCDSTELETTTLCAVHAEAARAYAREKTKRVNRGLGT